MKTVEDARRGRAAIIFALVTLIMGVFAASGMASYSQFIPAVDHIQVRLSSMNSHLFTLENGNPALEINASFTMVNPEGYNRLALRTFKSSLDMFSPTQPATITQGDMGDMSSAQPTGITQGAILHIPVSVPLDPGVPIIIDVPSFNTTYDAANLVKQNSEVQFVFSVDLTLRSFLDTAAQLRVSYVCQSNGGPVDCEQSEVIVITKPAASTRGGE